MRQRPDGLWEARGLVHGARRSYYARTKSGAAAKLRAAQGGPAPGPRVTVAACAALWLERAVAPHCRPTTYRRYESLLRCHLLPALGPRPVAALTPLLVEQVLGTLPPATSRQVRAVLRTLLSHAQRWELVTRNVAALARAPQPQRPPVAPYTPAEITRLLAAVAATPQGPAYLLALTTGLRLGELRALRWADIDWATGRVAITRQAQRHHGVETFPPPKSAAGRRTLHLPPALLPILAAQRAAQARSGLPNPEGWVWPGPDGRPIAPQTPNQHLHRLARRLGLPVRRWHDLRHSAASLMAALGESLHTIQHTLGHSQIALTANLYTHLLDDAKAAQAGRMSAWLEAVRGTEGVDSAEDAARDTDPLSAAPRPGLANRG